MNNYSIAAGFLPRVRSKEAIVGILGLGHVGIPCALSAVRAGLKVVGFDILQDRVKQLNGGKSPIKHISDKDIAGLIASGFKGTTDFSRVFECDALIICVTTPLSKHRHRL